MRGVRVSTGQRVQTPLQADARCAWCAAAAVPEAGRLATCPRCGAATTWPAPGGDELERAYGDWYRPSSGRFAAGGDALLRLSRGILARRLDRIAPPGPVLDVGAGEGALVRALRDRGREAVGLERRATGQGVIEAEVAEFQERLGQWSAVVFWHSLEHLRDPALALDRARDLLAPDGVLVVAMPNLESWQARLFGTRWFHLDVPRHLVHLPARTLARGLEMRGLRVERTSHWRGGQVAFGWLHGLVGELPGHPDLYDAIRRPQARRQPISPVQRTVALGAAVALSPLAAAAASAEVLAGAGGTICLEARR